MLVISELFCTIFSLHNKWALVFHFLHTFHISTIYIKDNGKEIICSKHSMCNIFYPDVRNRSLCSILPCSNNIVWEKMTENVQSVLAQTVILSRWNQTFVSKSVLKISNKMFCLIDLLNSSHSSGSRDVGNHKYWVVNHFLSYFSVHLSCTLIITKVSNFRT